MQQQNDSYLKTENLTCACSGNRAQLFCSSEICMQTDCLVCLDSKCQCQAKNHSKCSFVRTRNVFNQISHQRIRKQSWMNKLIEKTTKIYDDLIEKMSIQKQIMLLKLENFGVSQEGIQIIHKINEQRGRNMHGSLIHNFISRINKNKNKHEKFIEINEDRYLKLQRQQTETLQNFLKKMNKLVINLCKQKPAIQSKIIEQVQQEDTLKSFFDQTLDKVATEYKKLYRASQESFSTAIFHDKCDLKPNLLILVRTQANKIIGAFTPIEWDKQGIWKNSGASQTFLFSISNKEKYPNKNSQFVIGTNAAMGPLFGQTNGLYDMYIQDKADVVMNSDFAIGGCFGNERVSQSMQQYWTEFSGAQSGSKILLKQWEVYQVIFE